MQENQVKVKGNEVNPVGHNTDRTGMFEICLPSLVRFLPGRVFSAIFSPSGFPTKEATSSYKELQLGRSIANGKSKGKDTLCVLVG